MLWFCNMEKRGRSLKALVCTSILCGIPKKREGLNNKYKNKTIYSQGDMQE